MTTPNPTAGNSDASTLDRLEAYLAAEDGIEENDNDAEGDKPDAPTAAKPDKPESDDPAKSQEPQFTTAHLAAYLGVEESEIDVDADGQPVFKTKIDGKESTAKFSDLRKNYQLQGHAENRAREVAEKEKAAERKMQEAEQAVHAKLQEQQQSLQQLASINAVLQEELKGEYQSINWDELWQANPAQARQLERRFEQRQGRINAVFQEIQQRNARAQHEAETQRKANEDKSKAAQVTRLLTLIPEWKDASIADKERSEIATWLQKSGFEPEDLDLNKASQVYLLRKSWQHDTLQQSKPEIEKKLREAPNLVKPGTPPQNDGNSATLKSLKQQVKQTGGNGTKAVAQWLMETGKA